MESSGQASGFCLQRALRSIAYAGMTFTFAMGGAIVGSITGALKGQTTETGLVRGAGIGAVAGAVVSVELLESLIQGDSLSKIAMFASLLDGKIFREWVSPAMLKAYQWQMSTIEVSDRDLSDLFDVNSNKGLSAVAVEMLPKFEVTGEMTVDACEPISCAVCLQDFNDGESARRLPSCRHFFHTVCIDMWLMRHGSCPTCRQDV